jgi:hypothetical protein
LMQYVDFIEEPAKAPNVRKTSRPRFGDPSATPA